MQTIDIEAAAAAIYASIVADVEDVDTLYRSDRPDPSYDFMLRSFTDLHDFTDANIYLIDELGAGYDEADSATWNALADAVDALLKATPIMLMEARNG